MQHTQCTHTAQVPAVVEQIEQVSIGGRPRLSQRRCFLRRVASRAKSFYWRRERLFVPSQLLLTLLLTSYLPRGASPAHIDAVSVLRLHLLDFVRFDLSFTFEQFLGFYI